MLIQPRIVITGSRHS